MCISVCHNFINVKYSEFFSHLFVCLDVRNLLINNYFYLSNINKEALPDQYSILFVFLKEKEKQDKEEGIVFSFVTSDHTFGHCTSYYCHHYVAAFTFFVCIISLSNL
jgi:hypothetical protein|tara:strand:+ start:704 stop:1027 length:324 start_codon:yes stop_codon:yes gene_type:complete